MNIKIKKLSKIIEDLIVLNDINIEFRSGNTYGIIDKTGSGKSVLLAAICGLVFPTDGYIEVDGKIIGEDISFPENIGALVGMPGFISSYNGFKNLKTLARLKNNISDEEIVCVMKEVGLDPSDETKFQDYTEEKKQKLGIASAFMNCSRLLILDDPFYSLDENSINKIRKSIQKRKSAHSIIILSCKGDKRVETLCDEIFVMEEGRIIAAKNVRTKNKFKRIKEVLKLFFSFITAGAYQP